MQEMLDWLDKDDEKINDKEEQLLFLPPPKPTSLQTLTLVKPPTPPQRMSAPQRISKLSTNCIQTSTGQPVCQQGISLCTKPNVRVKNMPLLGAVDRGINGQDATGVPKTKANDAT